MEKLVPEMVIRNASQLLLIGQDVGDINLVEGGYLAIDKGKIVFAGNKKEYLEKVDDGKAEHIDAEGKTVLPGFVDCHTHLVFGGSRIDEYIGNLTEEGKKDLRSRNVKTGMYASVDMTRNEKEETLFNESLKKINKMKSYGTTTVEIKSGYGLDIETEMKQLRIIDRLKKESGVTVSSTFLGAHGWPENEKKEDYIEKLVKEILPVVAEGKLADACDIWVDDGYYSADEAERILLEAKKLGLEMKMHTDCYSYVGGSNLAVKHNMMSADHLNYLPEEIMEKMAQAKIPGVLLPGTDFSVNHPHPFDGRKMIDKGMKVALATNLNPGNWIESMQLIIALACRKHGFTPEEAIWASTLGGAKSLRMDSEIGSLSPGKYADIQIWDTEDYRDVAYKPGNNLVSAVFKAGVEILV